MQSAWQMSNRANLYLLDHIPEAHFDDRYSPRTRTVRKQFAHIHNVRLKWLSHAAPKLVGDLTSFGRKEEPGKDALRAALVASEAPVAAFLEASEAAGKVRNWNSSPASFLSYLVAHEAHHRGLVMVCLRACDHKLPQEVVYGVWDWGKKR